MLDKAQVNAWFSALQWAIINNDLSAHMPTQSQSYSALKLGTADVENFTPDAARQVTEVMMNNLKGWGELVQYQAQAVQAAAAESLAACQHVNEPKSAIEIMTLSAQKALALTARHLQQIVGLSVEQFKAGVDLMQRSHPVPDSFSELAQVMRVSATTMESATLSLLNTAPFPSLDRLR